MKIAVIIPLLLVLVCSCRTSRRDIWAESEAFQQWCRYTFRQDSGFVSSAQNTFFQQIIGQNDTAIFTADYVNTFLRNPVYDAANFSKLDTFPVDSSGGKYYRGKVQKDFTQWLLCAPSGYSLSGEDPWVFEITEEKDRFRLAGWQDFHHGNYACCWNKPMDGFYKIGPWFFVNTCNTGSGFCASTANLLLLPFSQSVDTLNMRREVPVSYSQWFFSDISGLEQLDGKLMVQHDTIVGEYRFTMDSIIHQGDENEKYITFEDVKFKALYKIDTVRHSIYLLNRDEVTANQGTWMFGSDQ